MATLTFLILWVYPWEFMPLTVDSSFYPIMTLSPWVIDIVLLFLFALASHSLKEKSLVATFREIYQKNQKDVPMSLPSLKLS